MGIYCDLSIFLLESFWIVSRFCYCNDTIMNIFALVFKYICQDFLLDGNVVVKLLALRVCKSSILNYFTKPFSTVVVTIYNVS